jgi:hypothetical protein
MYSPVEAKETRESIRNKLIFCASLISLTFVFSIVVFFFPSIKPISEEHGIWFQRSGSFLVMAAIITEFFLVRLKGYLDTYNERYIMFSDVPPYIYNMHKELSKAVIIFAVYGTIVWGYGDLFV